MAITSFTTLKLKLLLWWFQKLQQFPSHFFHYFGSILWWSRWAVLKMGFTYPWVYLSRSKGYTKCQVFIVIFNLGLCKSGKIENHWSRSGVANPLPAGIFLPLRPFQNAIWVFWDLSFCFLLLENWILVSKIYFLALIS